MIGGKLAFASLVVIVINLASVHVLVALHDSQGRRAQAVDRAMLITRISCLVLCGIGTVGLVIGCLTI